MSDSDDPACGSEMQNVQVARPFSSSGSQADASVRPAWRCSNRLPACDGYR